MTTQNAPPTDGSLGCVRFGLVGTGRQAGKYVAPLSSQGRRITALFHPRGKGFDGRLTPVAPGAPVPQIADIAQVTCFTDFAKFADSDLFDVAVITSPTEFHAEQAAALAEAGKLVLVEKPLATKIGDVLRLNRLADRIVPILPVPFFTAHSQIRRLLNTGTLGRVRRISLCRECPPPSWSAHFASSACGGALWDLAIHDLHFACLLCGTLTRRESAVEFSADGSLPIFVKARFSVPNPQSEHIAPGCEVELTASWKLATGFNQALVVGGTNATLSLEGDQLKLTDSAGCPLPLTQEKPAEQGFAALLSSALRRFDRRFQGSAVEIPELAWTHVVHAHQLLDEIATATAARCGSLASTELSASGVTN